MCCVELLNFIDRQTIGSLQLPLILSFPLLFCLPLPLLFLLPLFFTPPQQLKILGLFLPEHFLTLFFKLVGDFVILHAFLSLEALRAFVAVEGGFSCLYNWNIQIPRHSLNNLRIITLLYQNPILLFTFLLPMLIHILPLLILPNEFKLPWIPLLLNLFFLLPRTVLLMIGQK